MIKIPVDEAYAFDMLSILEIKFLESKKDPSFEESLMQFYGCLIQEFGVGKFLAITVSKEYDKLKKANLNIFKRINAMKKRKATGKDALYIDSMNYRRFLAKKELQKKFFPKLALSEQKLGYKK